MSASGIRAGRAFVEISLRDRLTSELANAQRRLRAFGQGLRGLGATTGALGTTMATPFAGAITAFAGFDAKMAKVKALTGAVGADFDSLRDKAKQLGSTTQFSASQAAEAMGFLGMAGYNTEQILSGIGPVLSLAAAGALELGVAADIASDVASAFGFAADEIGHVADVIAATATGANTSVEMMGETFKQAAPLAAAAGQTIEEFSAAAGLLGNSGVKASKAGTDLKNILLAFSDTAAHEKLAKLGIAAVDASGNIRPMLDVMSDLGDATRDLPGAKRLAAYNDVFGRISASSAAILADAGKSIPAPNIDAPNVPAIKTPEVPAVQVPKIAAIQPVVNDAEQRGNLSPGTLPSQPMPNTPSPTLGDEPLPNEIQLPDGPAPNPIKTEVERKEFVTTVQTTEIETPDTREATTAIEVMRGKMRDASGAAERMAVTMQDSLAGVGTRIMSALEGVGIEIGESLNGPLTSLGNALASSLSSLTEFITKNRGLVLGLAAGSGVLMAVGAGLIAAGVAAHFAAIGVGALATIAGIAMSPLLLLGAAAAGIGVYFAASSKVAKNALSVVSKAFGSVINKLNAGDLSGAGKELMETLGKGIRASKDVIFNAVAGAMASARDAIAGSSVLKGLLLFAGGIGFVIVAVKAFAAVMAVAGAALAGISAAVGIIGAGIAFLTTPLGAVAALIGVLAIGFESATGGISKSVGWIQQRFGELLSTVSTIVKGIASKLMAGDIAGAGKLATTAIELAWLQLSSKVQSYWGAAMQYVSGLVEPVKDAIKSLGAVVDGLVDKLKTLWESATEAYNAYYNAVHDKVVETIVSVGSDVQTIGPKAPRAEGDNQLAKDMAADRTRLKRTVDNLFSESETSKGKPTKEAPSPLDGQIAALQSSLASQLASIRDNTKATEENTSTTADQALAADAKIQSEIANAESAATGPMPGDAAKGNAKAGEFSGFAINRSLSAAMTRARKELGGVNAQKKVAAIEKAAKPAPVARKAVNNMADKLNSRIAAAAEATAANTAEIAAKLAKPQKQTFKS